MLTRPTLIAADEFHSAEHFYPKVLDAQIHPVVRKLLSSGNNQIATHYCRLHPEVDPAAVEELLMASPDHFRWGGCDLFKVTTESGTENVVVVETNSCPSGQKSMPRDGTSRAEASLAGKALTEETQKQAGYRTVMQNSFLPALQQSSARNLPGHLAVIYDKNHMEASGYAAALASLTTERVWLVPFHKSDEGDVSKSDAGSDNCNVQQTVRFQDGVLQINDGHQWINIRGAFRYVTQQPWNRIPPLTRTMIYNPVVVCLAGGRNKLVASKAYDIYNTSMQSAGLHINTPETIVDVRLDEVPMWVQRMGGVAVVKVPYFNAGQGVFTITSQKELDAFLHTKHRYDHFIVQALIGNAACSSTSQHGQLFHVGTLRDTASNSYVADLRFMVSAGPAGFFPVAIYARRARKPMQSDLTLDGPSWEMLGTNLSVKQSDSSFSTQSERLLLVDTRDFDQLGFSLDDLIESYVQTVMSVMAIDQMASRLISPTGSFLYEQFASINPDRRFLSELVNSN